MSLSRVAIAKPGGPSLAYRHPPKPKQGCIREQVISNLAFVPGGAEANRGEASLPGAASTPRSSRTRSTPLFLGDHQPHDINVHFGIGSGPGAQGPKKAVHVLAAAQRMRVLLAGSQLLNSQPTRSRRKVLPRVSVLTCRTGADDRYRLSPVLRARVVPPQGSNARPQN